MDTNPRIAAGVPPVYAGDLFNYVVDVLSGKIVTEHVKTDTPVLLVVSPDRCHDAFDRTAVTKAFTSCPFTGFKSTTVSFIDTTF